MREHGALGERAVEELRDVERLDPRPGHHPLRRGHHAHGEDCPGRADERAEHHRRRAHAPEPEVRDCAEVRAGGEHERGQEEDEQLRPDEAGEHVERLREEPRQEQREHDPEERERALARRRGREGRSKPSEWTRPRPRRMAPAGHAAKRIRVKWPA